MLDIDALPRGLKLHYLGGLEIVAGRYRDHTLPRHSHDGLMLSLLGDGIQKVHYKGASHNAGAGSIVAIPPHGVHGAEPEGSDGWMFHSITVPVDVLESVHPEGGRFACQSVMVDDVLSHLFKRLFTSFTGESALHQETALFRLVEHFLKAHTHISDFPQHRRTEKRAVEISKDYLADNLDRNVTLDELAKVARMDKFLLVRCFTDILGISPHAWHRQRQFQKSLELLSRGARIAEVAAQTGFADQSHLTRVFKKMTGITPGTYRKDHLTLLTGRGSVLPPDIWPRLHDLPGPDNRAVSS
ncbi:AraC family transcriptional regulator [Tistrella sp. BH-R2-4]|uniref:AraC family transcriptional regulator n=1 Tax=Tistrella arctica TaxID=3133430 RepID=A0ABU9YHT4_9PROT